MAKKTPHNEKPAGEFMEVGKEVVPGMRLRCVCRGHTGTIGRIAWSPCGRFIVSASSDRTIRIWDANDGKCLRVMQSLQSINCIAWSPDSTSTFFATSAGAVHIWPIENGTSTEQTIGYESTPIISMAWSRRGLATATTAELRIWNPNDWTFMEFSNFNALLIAVSWDSSGDLLACARQHEDGLVFWEDELVDKIPRWDVGFGSGIEVRCVAQATRSNLFAAGLSSDEIVLLTFHAWGGKGTLEGHTGDICSVGISPDGRFVASKSLDNTLRLWCAVG